MDDYIPDERSESDTTLKFDYIKSPSFRSIHMDGAYGSFTPTGLLQIALYNERFAIPQRLVHNISPDGTIGPEIRRIQKDVVREVDVNIVMSVTTAQTLVQWLQTMIDGSETITPQTSTDDEGE